MIGLQSTGHGPQSPIDVVYEQHPIMNMFEPGDADPMTPVHSYFKAEPFEDQGAIVYDGAADKSRLCVFEPKALAKGPIAAVPLPLQPYGFHGFWEGAAGRA